jgi:putative oxidoreductase
VLDGYAKLSRGADGVIAILHAMGVPFTDLLGWATIIVEIVGGLLILAGAFAPVAAVPMIVVLLLRSSLSIAGLLALCVGGAGPFFLLMAF